MRIVKIYSPLCAAVLTCAPFSISAAYAADKSQAAANQTAANPPADQGWTITARANGGLSPSWDGADGLSPYLLPSLSIRRAGSPVAFTAPDDAVSFALYDAGWLRAGAAGRLRGPRHQSEHTELHGVHDIDWTLEAGMFAEFWPTPKIRTRVEVRHGFMGHHGWTADVAGDWVEKHGPWTASIGPRMSFGDKSYMNKLYGVSAVESQINGRVTPYQGYGGVKSVGVSGAVTYEWSKSWSTTAYARYSRLLGSAADSSLVRKVGSRDQFVFGAIVAYSFDWKGF